MKQAECMWMWMWMWMYALKASRNKSKASLQVNNYIIISYLHAEDEKIFWAHHFHG
jgi:hypothetical protein